MKKTLALALAVSCTLAGRLAYAQEIVLGRDTNIVIKTEGRMDNAGPVLKDLLAKYLRRALKKEKLEDQGETVRFVLRAKAVNWQGMHRDEMSDNTQIDAFEISADATAENTIHITGETVLATGFGIFHFLDRYLDIVWAFPGELGICVPERSEFRLKIKREQIAPVFASRFHSGIVDYCPEYVARNPQEGIVHKQRGFFRADDCIKSLRLHILNTVNHNMIQIFPVKECKERYPEIFPIKNGKRYVPPESSQNWHPCYTNPKTIEIATRKAIKRYENGGMSFSMGVNDGRKVQCECEECKKLGFPDSYYDFVTRVGENVKSYYPPHTIGVLAYGDVAEPPADLVLPDNVVVYASGSLAITKDGGKHLMRWGKRAKHLSVYEYLCGDHYWFPNFQFRIMQSNIEFFRKANAKYYWAMTYPMWPFDGPKMYINTRLLWERDVDIDAALERYCAAAFGRGGKHMAEFYKRWASVRDRDLVPNGVSPTWSYAELRRPDVQFARCSPDDYRYATTCLEKAKKAAQDPKVQRRLEMVETFFEYGKTLFNALRLRKEVFEYARGNDWRALSSEALRLWTRRQHIIETFRKHPEWFLGTRCTLDWILSKEWEDDERWTINYELPNAVRTALFHASKQRGARQADAKAVPPDFRIALNPYQSEPLWFRSIVQKYGYYHKDLYNLMISSPSETGISFHTNPDVSWKVPEDAQLKDYWGNGMKKAVFAGRVKMDRKSYYLFSFDLTGREGTLMLRVMNLDAGGKMVWIEEPFKGTPQRRIKQMLLKPQPRNGGSDPSWNVEMIFTPNSEAAAFSGTCVVAKLDFKTDGGK